MIVDPLPGTLYVYVAQHVTLPVVGNRGIMKRSLSCFTALMWRVQLQVSPSSSESETAREWRPFSVSL